MTGAVAVRVDRDWRPIAETERHFDVDTVCIGYGFLPSLEIPRLLGCRSATTRTRAATFRCATPTSRAACPACRRRGWRRRRPAVPSRRGGSPGSPAARPAGAATTRPAGAARRLSSTVGPGIYEWATDETIVCRCEEVTVGEVRRHIRPDSRDPNAVKSLTRIGMGLCQGHNCSQQVSAIFAQETGRPLIELPPLSPRPPFGRCQSG